MNDAATGLVKWWDSLESGADNNPALVRTTHNSIAGVDVNSFLVLEYRAMAIIADRIHRQEEAAAFRERAQRLSRAVNVHLWDPGDATYYSIDTVDKTRLRHITYSNQVALWARLASKDQAQVMIERHVLNPSKLWAPHGLRSLAADDPLYNNENVIKPYSNWQGPIWPHANWMVMHGLIHYGYPEAAVEVAERVTRLCVEDLARNGMMHENYHADTGAPLAAPNFISWNLLVAQMMEEARIRVFKPDPTQALWVE
jgi:alpha,alpha-trehalase